MSLQEFREYVSNSGVDFDTLTIDQKRQWRETFLPPVIGNDITVYR